MIQNAKDIKLCSSTLGLPDVGIALLALLQTVKILLITQQLIGGYNKEIIETIYAKAVIIPNDQPLKMAKEGDREWDSSTVYCTPEFSPSNNDVFILLKKRYRVVNKSDFSQYGYMKLSVTEDYAS